MQSAESTPSRASPDCLHFGDDDESEVFQSEDERSEVAGGHSRSALSSSSSGLGWSGAESEQEKENKTVGGTEGDVLFAQKCLELQGFIRPLLELLNGLKKGRFDKGLSSFQQSVAMDRIQRIVGVLQKPHIGEKYLPTLLQVEMMLKLWFPQVILQPEGAGVSRQLSGPGASSSSAAPPHKQKDQMRIPVKKRKLSWSDSDSSPTPAPVARKCLRVKGQERTEQSRGLSVRPAPASRVDLSDRSSEEISGPRGFCWADPGLTWVHVAPIPSPPKSCPSLGARDGGGKDLRDGHFPLAPPPPGNGGSPATQDSSISSTTPCPEPAAYQIQPQAGTQTEGRSQSPPVTEQLSSLIQT